MGVLMAPSGSGPSSGDADLISAPARFRLGKGYRHSEIQRLWHPEDEAEAVSEAIRSSNALDLASRFSHHGCFLAF